MKHLLLSSYLKHLEIISCEVCNFFDFEVSAVSNNSLNVKDNSVFVAVKGTETDGHKYINDAIARGARAVFHNQEIQKQSGVSYIRVEDSYYAYALLCEKYFDEPSKKLKLIGITGTNGKTTSAYLLKSVLESLGKKVGLLSTVEYSFGDRVISAQRTTPEAFELQTVFHKMVEADCEYCVMEVSSHALDQRRIGSARFDGVIFTNLSGDHLDYHKDMKSYFLAKERLFTEYLKKAGKAVTNCDDPYGKNLGVTTFGLSDISDYNIIPSRDLFSRCMDGIINSGETFILSPHLLGLYNSYNVAGVFALLSELGFNKQKVAHALSEKISVPGRLERICGRKNILYFVDYAHSDDALRRVLTALRELKPKKLISVFGCGGNRDKTKRPRMGKISAELADFTIVTSDNPRKEVPSEIIKDILEGIRITGVPPVNEKEDIHGRACPLPESARDARGTGKYNVIEDRRRAIFEAVRMAEEKDIVLIAGKGHEDYQEIMGVRYPFSDKEVLKKAINEVEGLRS